MASLQGFWSYVHSDDQADNGRITSLAKDIVNQFEMLTGESIELFVDLHIKWGEIWQEKIDKNLSSVAFFIPVITPRYFMSVECRRELQFFIQRASEIGVKDLVLPLIYIDFPALHETSNGDELIKQVCTFEWEDWHDIRFSEISSERYRRGVSKLASRLVEANKHAEERTAIVSVISEEEQAENDEEKPGIIDLLAYYEETLKILPETLQEITRYITQIGQNMKEGASDIAQGTAQGNGFAARLFITKKIANQIKEPTEHIWSLSNTYATQMHAIDAGLSVIFERAPSEVKEDPEARKNFCSFFGSVQQMSEASIRAMNATKTMIEVMEPLEKMSRDLRPVVRLLKQGLTIQFEATKIAQEWMNSIKSTGIICEENNSNIIESS